MLLFGAGCCRVITAVRDIPSFAVYFSLYEYSKAWLSQGQPDGACDWQILASGGLAGVVAWASIYPLDTVKTIIQSQPASGGISANPVTAWRQVTAGVGGHAVLWRGFSACCLRALPLNACAFWGYEFTITKLNTWDRA